MFTTKRTYRFLFLCLLCFSFLSGSTPFPRTSVTTVRVYVAILWQSGSDAPTATVIKNDLGGDVVWTRMVAGKYRATLAGAFPLGKSYVPNNLAVYPGSYVIYTAHANVNFVDVYSENWDLEQQDGLIQGVMILIRVYP